MDIFSIIVSSDVSSNVSTGVKAPKMIFSFLSFA